MTDQPRCETCAAPFAPTKASRRYCSARCRETAKSRRKRAKRSAEPTGGENVEQFELA